jgi:hypothetical protein
MTAKERNQAIFQNVQIEVETRTIERRSEQNINSGKRALRERGVRLQREPQMESVEPLSTLDFRFWPGDRE